MSVAANAAGQLPKSIVKTNAEAKPLDIRPLAKIRVSDKIGV